MLGAGIGGGSDDDRSGVPDVWHRASRERPFCHSCGSPVNGADTHPEYRHTEESLRIAERFGDDFTLAIA